MKKRLLMVAAFALAMVGSSFAYNVGEYAYNSTQRFKILGENKVQNGNFAQGRDGWFGADAASAPSADVWDIAEGVGPNGENALQSLGSGSPLCNKWSLDPGSYIVSIDVQFTAAGNTSIITGGQSAGTNAIDFFLNNDGSFEKKASTDEAPVVNVASASFVPAEEWTSLVWFCTVEQGQQLVMHIENLSSDYQITNIAIHEAIQVYDVRIAQRRLDFVSKLMEDPNFNTDEAQDAKANLQEIMATIQEMMATEEFEDPDNAANMMMAFEEDGVKPFLDVTSTNIGINSFFNYVEDLEDMGNYNRGSISNGQQIGGFVFRGSDWQHGSYRNGNTIVAGPNGKTGLPYLLKQIQGTYTTGPGSVALANNALPAGKYFIAADMFNAYCDKDYNLTYSLENEVKAFVGSDTVSCGTIVGPDYVRFYTVGELKEGEPMEAGFFWNNTATSGASFRITNFEARAFGDILEPYYYNKAWSAFIAQYNAAVSGRQNVVDKVGAPEYPWGQDSLKNALATWDPYYNAVMAKGWVTADGGDAGLATTDELNDWAQYQGVEMYNEEGVRLEYQLVRGYQNANNYVIAANQIITDLANAITAAEDVLNDPLNGEGDKATFQKVIDDAKAVLDDVRKNTNDERREADEARVNEAIAALAEATEVFKESGRIEPFITIDFSQGVTTDEETGNYIAKGVNAVMDFGTIFSETNNSGTQFALGYGEECLDVLRVGNAAATVAIAEDLLPTDQQILRVSFNVWFAKLSGKSLYVNLLNEAGERVAGFQYELYNNITTYNDFNNADNTGMELTTGRTVNNLSNVNNVSIYTDANKSTIELLVDYKYQAVQGILNTNRGSFTGAWVPFRTTIDDAGTPLSDTKVTTFQLGSNYNNDGRRCWFDNLTMKKYASPAAGPIDSGIRSYTTVKVANQGVYTIGGMKVNSDSQLPAGLYIINGKKVVVK